MTDNYWNGSSSLRDDFSHGRGGAGNIHPPTTADLNPDALETPSIKSNIYTTGRGGTGNMAPNTDPISARRAQDVEASPVRSSESDAHVGRGGVANVFRASEEQPGGMVAGKGSETDDGDEDEKLVAEQVKVTERTGVDQGLANRGKKWLFEKVGRI